MLRANPSSVLPPEFRDKSLLLAGTGIPLSHRFRCAVSVFRYRFPITWEYVGAYWYSSGTFSPLLEGYFHNPVTKIYTCHLLSVHLEIMYSSLSLHF